jgi:hypothetical protein
MSKEEVREDYLEEDNEISGQKYVLLSFLSPEKVLANKDVFMFSRFVKDYEIQYKTKKLENFLVSVVQDINDKLEKNALEFDKADLSGAAVLCRTSKLSIEQMVEATENYVRKSQKEITDTKINEDYDDFLYKSRAKLEDEFYAQNNFRTTVRGLKVRGVYGAQQEAVNRAKKLQRTDTIHNIFVGEVGKWLPWDPNPNDVSDQEYAEDQLNTLMKKYKENEEAREEFQKEQRKLGRKVDSKPKSVLGMDGTETKPTEVKEGTAEASMFAPSNTASEYGGMFSGPADLVLERKKAAAEAKKKSEQ